MLVSNLLYTDPVELHFHAGLLNILTDYDEFHRAITTDHRLTYEWRIKSANYPKFRQTRERGSTRGSSQWK
jgi:hypothetical protein